MLVFDTVRGEHSTGIAAVVRHNDEVKVSKCVGDPFILFDQRKTEAIFGTQTSVLIGHNRYATQGKINARNAHPFQFENVVGVHNGTLHNHKSLPEGNKYDVDSEAIYHNIDDLGPFKTVEKMRGAWALVWWDLAAKSLNFVRNKERPLYIAFSESGQQVYWASEPWMITVACSRHNVKLLAEPALLSEDVLMSFKIPATNTKFAEPELLECPGAPPYQVVQQQSHYLPGNKGHNQYTDPIINRKEPIMLVPEAISVNGTGSRIFDCFSPDYKDKVFRIVVPTTFTRFTIGMDSVMEGLVGWKSYDADQKCEVYYIKQESITELVEHATEADVMAAVENALDKLADGEEPDEQVYLGHKKQSLTKSEWLKAYPFCSWCTGDVDPEDDNVFTGGGDVICPHCKELEDVKPFYESSNVKVM